MAAKHPKNTLQEIFQRQQLPLPQYNAQSFTSESGKQFWRATVTLHDGRMFEGDKCGSKIAAEGSAAVKAQETITTLKTVPQRSYQVAILVDMESLPSFVDCIDLNSFVVYAYIRESHFLATRKFSHGVISMIATDTPTYMSMSLALMLYCDSHDEYIIATTQSYAQTLVQMITTPYLGWKPKPARIITSPWDLMCAITH